MLSYSVKLNNDNIKKDEVVWGEKYLSPDLSFVTGVTNQDYHLENLNKIEASINDKSDILNIQSENVTREGYVIVKEKRYPVVNDTVFINGKYYYVDDNDEITVDNWLVKKYIPGKEYDNNTSAYTETYHIPSVETKTITASVSDDNVLIDTIYWIENGKVRIDDNEYFFDRNEVGGALKYFEDGQTLSGTEVTDCTDIEFYPIDKASDFINITKFRLTKDEDREVNIVDISYISHFTYIKYNNNYYPIELEGDYYVCKIGDKTYSAYTDDDLILTSSNVTDYENLSELGIYIKFSDGSNLYAENMVQNSNNGRKIGLYLSDTYDNINTGDIIRAKKNSPFTQHVIVEYIDDEPFVLYDGTRYEIYSGLVNTVLINEVEYNIVNCDSANSYVDIEGEYIPMSGNCSAETLGRYGLIISGDSAVTTSYPVIHYSGVTISGIDYKVIEDEFSNFILLETGITHKLRVIETIGNSLIVCEPDLSDVEFSDDYIKDKTYSICNEIVSESFTYHFYIKNPLFGEREILPNNGKIYDTGATSTDDYQNVLESLKLYTNIGYILLPVNLEASTESNMLLDDIRKKEFVDVETEKVINPIIDMERDIYVPKYIDNSFESLMAYTEACTNIDGRGSSMFSCELSDEEKKHSYIGSYTDFKPIREIQINFHFRTRDSVSWKIKEEYNDASASATCNWFVTDYEPYKTIIDNGSGDTLMDVSDVLDLLYFNNMDVYYQKKSLEKSFARLSYYDNINPQTQSLLHTSTVFVNEHDLFKKYIDNSRKNISDFMLVQEPKDGAEPSITNKISVGTEYIKEHKPHETYTFTDAKVNNEEKRLSSRLSILNKYETDTSSEGFYLYIFKQYAENLHAKPIYMKIDFNHAKIGKTIPFVIPMKWSGDTEYVYPIERLTLSNQTDTGDTGSTSDLEELKQGIPLSYLYGQLYIPLYAMYDFKNKEYGYVFDDRYVEITDDGIAKINLFEIKIKNNSETYSNDEAAEHNAGLDGALQANTPLSEEEATIYNEKIPGAQKAEGDELTEEANFYNETLDGAIHPGDAKSITTATAVIDINCKQISVK